MGGANMCDYILSVNRILNEKFDAVENESVLENLIETGSKYPVAIISSCGSTKSGNSTLLNFIYKALKRKSNPATAGDPIDWNNYAEPLTGFPWSSGNSRTTKGIWITKEPVLISHNHQTVAVYLMDIEGIFDMEFLSNEESEIILGFAILLSTNLLFTMQHGISESRLFHLAKVLHKLKTDFPDLGMTNIHLVVKDWFSAKAVDLEAGDTYLLQKMTTSDEHSKQHKFTRRVLNESLGPKLSCTMFPRLVDGDCDSNFIASLEQLNGNYLTVLEKFLLSNRVFNFNRLFHNGNQLKIHLDSFRKFFLGLNRTPNDTKELIRSYVEDYKNKMKIRFERENLSEIPSLQAVEEYHHLNVEKIEKKLGGEISLNKLTKDECLQVLGEINDEYKLGKDQLTQILDEHEVELRSIAQKHLEECQREQLDLLKINHDKFFEQQINGSIMSAIDKFKDKAVQGNPEIVGRLTLWLKFELDEHTRNLADQRRTCLHSVVENIEIPMRYSILHQPTTSYIPNPEDPIPIQNIEEVAPKPAVVTPKPRARAGISSNTITQSPQSLSSPQTSDTTKKELMLAYEEKLRNWDNVHDPLNFANEFKDASDKIVDELNEPEYDKEFRLIFDEVVQEKGEEIRGKLNKEAQLLDEIELSHTVILRLGIQEKSRSSDSGVILGVDKLIRTATEEFRRKSPFQNCASYIIKTSAQFEKKLHNVLTQIAQEENKNMILSELENANLVHEVSSWYCTQMDKSFAREDYIEPQTLNEIHGNNIKTAKEKFCQNIPTKTKTVELTLDKLFVEYKEKNQMNKPGNVAIGIDLGTTYCCVGIYRKGKVEIISDRYGSTIPSYVALLGSGELIGHEAKEKAHISPEETIFDAKRLIGRKFDDPQVQNDIKLWPFKVTSNDNVPQVEVNKNTYEPEKISAKLLYYIKELAKTHLKGQEVVDAVITVPAAFGDGQRQATKDAAFIAGLNVLRIINEPTAAALAYNLQRFAAKNGGKKNILVYDLGGGTFDVSILAVQNGELVVKATDGDTHLGGEDFDEALVNHCLNEFHKTNGFSLTSTTGPKALSKSQISKLIRRIRNVCEGAKRTLSDLPKVQIDIAQIAHGKDLQLSITRQEFESMNMKRFQDTMTTVENTLREAKLTKDQIDDVVLVGGSTKIPKIRQLLETYFGKKPVSNINADEAVAYGAAIQAAILNGEIPDVILQDVCSSSLGIELHDGSMSVVIKRNEPLPVSQERSHYVPARKGQSSVTIFVYQGEHRIANQNDMLGKFELKNLPTKYIPNITVRMEMSLEGIIHVTASCEGEKANIQINLREGKGRMSERRIESAKKEIQRATKATG